MVSYLDGVGTSHLVSKLLDTMYPIGSVYISENETSPAAIYGGSWERYAKGRTLCGTYPGMAEDAPKSSDGKPILPSSDYTTAGNLGGHYSYNLSSDRKTRQDEIINISPDYDPNNEEPYFCTGDGWRVLAGATFDSSGRIWYHQNHLNGVDNNGYYIKYDNETRSASNIGYDWNTGMSAQMARDTIVVGGVLDIDVQNPHVVVNMWKRTA